MRGEGSGSGERRNDLKFGFTVTHPDRRRVAALEALPIDSLWAGGHVASRNPTPEAMVQLAQLAALTERVRIGTSILLLPLYPPAIVAKQVADLDRATGGRLILGVGVGGEYPQEFRACGVPLAERGVRTNEAIPLLRRLWTAEEIRHEGRFYPMDNVKVHPAPLQPGGPPIVVAGRQPAAMRRAAALGDGWMPYLYSPRRFAESVGSVRDYAAAAGRDLSGFAWMQFLFICVRDDPEQARAAAAAHLGGTYSRDFRPIVDRVAAAGTVEQVRQRVQEFVDAGARHFIFSPVGGGDPVEDARRIMTEIVPAVQRPVVR
jgi:probable F420-dependent oxidoreductase